MSGWSFSSGIALAGVTEPSFFCNFYELPVRTGDQIEFRRNLSAFRTTQAVCSIWHGNTIYRHLDVRFLIVNAHTDWHGVWGCPSILITISLLPITFLDYQGSNLSDIKVQVDQNYEQELALNFIAEQYNAHGKPNNSIRTRAFIVDTKDLKLYCQCCSNVSLIIRPIRALCYMRKGSNDGLNRKLVKFQWFSCVHMAMTLVYFWTIVITPARDFYHCHGSPHAPIVNCGCPDSITWPDRAEERKHRNFFTLGFRLY